MSTSYNPASDHSEILSDPLLNTLESAIAQTTKNRFRWGFRPMTIKRHHSIMKSSAKFCFQDLCLLLVNTKFCVRPVVKSWHTVTSPAAVHAQDVISKQRVWNWDRNWAFHYTMMKRGSSFCWGVFQEGLYSYKSNNPEYLIIQHGVCVILLD